MRCLKPTQGMTIWRTKGIPERCRGKARQSENSKKNRERLRTGPSKERESEWVTSVCGDVHVPVPRELHVETPTGDHSVSSNEVLVPRGCARAGGQARESSWNILAWPDGSQYAQAPGPRGPSLGTDPRGNGCVFPRRPGGGGGFMGT